MKLRVTKKNHRLDSRVDPDSPGVNLSRLGLKLVGLSSMLSSFELFFVR